MPQVKNALLDFMAARLKAKNDSALAKKLSLAPPILSKLRHGRYRATPGILIIMHEASDVSITMLRFLSGDFREHTGKNARELSSAEVQAFLKKEGVSQSPEKLTFETAPGEGDC